MFNFLANELLGYGTELACTRVVTVYCHLASVSLHLQFPVVWANHHIGGGGMLETMGPR